MLFYLAGSIEYSPDLGKGWRAEITPTLTSLGHEIYDPAEDELKNLTEVEARDFRSWKKDDLPRFQDTVRKIIAYDLDLIEHCDAVVCYWDQYAGRGAGTQGELTFAHRLGVPVYLICGMPVQEISGWLLGCATEVFISFDHFHDFARQTFVREVACGSAALRPEPGNREAGNRQPAIIESGNRGSRG